MFDIVLIMERYSKPKIESSQKPQESEVARLEDEGGSVDIEKISEI